MGWGWKLQEENQQYQRFAFILPCFPTQEGTSAFKITATVLKAISDLYYLSIQSCSSFTLSSSMFKSYCQFAKCIFELADVFSEEAPLLSAGHYQHTGSPKSQRKLLIFLRSSTDSSSEALSLCFVVLCPHTCCYNPISAPTSAAVL